MRPVFGTPAESQLTPTVLQATVSVEQPSQADLLAETYETIKPREEVPMSTIKSLEESAEERLLERFGKTRSALGPGTVIQGKLTFDTTIRIDGKLSGDVFSSKAIIVGKSGTIDAQIEVAVLVVIGRVKGEIRASERVEIIGGGYVEGTVETPKLVIEPGAVLNGACRMSAARAKKAGSLENSSSSEPHESSKNEASSTGTEFRDTDLSSQTNSSQSNATEKLVSVNEDAELPASFEPPSQPIGKDAAKESIATV